MISLITTFKGFKYTTMAEFNKYEFFSYDQENDCYIDGELKEAYYDAKSHIILQQNSNIAIATEDEEEVSTIIDMSEVWQESYDNLMLYVEENCLSLLDRCTFSNYTSFLKKNSK